MAVMPVFVKIEEYENVTALLLTVRRKLEDAKSTLARINQLKDEEDAQVQTWQTALSEIEARMDAIDQVLQQPETF